MLILSRVDAAELLSKVLLAERRHYDYSDPILDTANITSL